MNRAKARKKATLRKSPSQAMALAFVGVGLFIVGGLALLLLPRSGGSANPEDPQQFTPAVPLRVEFPAPDLRLQQLDSQPVSLSDYQGQVVLVNNWAFWCPPCRAELPELQTFYEKHQEDNFTVIGIEAGGELVDVQYHVDLYKLSFPVWLDPQTEALRAFRNGTLPNSYVIDRQGTVRLAWNGPINLAKLEEYVTPLIREQ
ncbi:MAG: hypothetical protein B6D39_10300 [Anaerolineae bacterium UTCFX2]|jgi:peroxiredoxin|nr:TlpA family protein disulfide reductase [Anaerolineae bacterium]MCZ7552233.1 TlpA family protein disulfide reductase [Anaerolineales bacterium]OQY89098.1 MAG: hypothetical protein B6D39_10300 [Anaerolineae bacterium UTCFX2]